MIQHCPPTNKRAGFAVEPDDQSAGRENKNSSLHPAVEKAYSEDIQSKPLQVRVLVVHHRMDITRIVAAMFEKLGYHAFWATDSAKALHLWHRKSFDLLFTELDMPFLDGYQLTRLIKQNSPQAKTAIMTSRCQAEVVDLINHGANDAWLFKPFKLGDLCKMLLKVDMAQMACIPPERPLQIAN